MEPLNSCGSESESNWVIQLSIVSLCCDCQANSLFSCLAVSGSSQGELNLIFFFFSKLPLKKKTKHYRSSGSLLQEEHPEGISWDFFTDVVIPDLCLCTSRNSADEFTCF